MKTSSSASLDHVVLTSIDVSFNLSPQKIDKPWLYYGRFGRLSFLAWAFIYALMLMPLMAVILYWQTGFSVLAAHWSNPPQLHLSTYLLLAAPMLILGYLLFTAGARRFHDLGFSGWWALLMFIPIFNVPVGLYMILIEGNSGTNPYGPPRETAFWEAVLGLTCIALKIAAWAVIFTHFNPVVGTPV